MSSGSNGVDWVHWLRKIPTRLHGTNFCSCSAHFEPSFVSQPNGPKCTKIVRNAPKHEFRVQWCGMGAFVEKNSDTASWHKLLHQFGPFCTEFRKSTKRSKMHQNICLGSNGGSGAFVAKNSDATSWHELLHHFGPFFTEFRKSTKRSKMHQNCMHAPKHEFRV